jgi:dTDP-4-amino-4,6-dideoxygalactose transaminase
MSDLVRVASSIGPEVAALEKASADFCAPGMSSCAMAPTRLMVLMARCRRGRCQVRRSHFAHRVLALTGATPVFVDADAVPTTWMLPAPACIATAKQRGLKPRAVIPVDLSARALTTMRIAESREPRARLCSMTPPRVLARVTAGRRIGSLGT